jgi:hypothetical protein
MFRFTIRDVLWLTLVAALAIGWWADQDRIRRQTMALRAAEENHRAAAGRLQNMSLQRAQMALRVTELELAVMEKIKQRNPGAVTDNELQRMQAQAKIARLDVEIAEAREDAAGYVSIPEPNRIPVTDGNGRR